MVTYSETELYKNGKPVEYYKGVDIIGWYLVDSKEKLIQNEYWKLEALRREEEHELSYLNNKPKTSFERYLLEQGFEVYHYIWEKSKRDFRKRKGYCELSSLGNVFNSYVRDDIRITMQLGVHRRGAYVLYPELPYAFKTNEERLKYNDEVSSYWWMDNLNNENLLNMIIDIKLKQMI